MQILSTILVALVALEHLYILYMEMFAWETLGKKTFKGSLPNELFKPTKKLAANQGLYNGFLVIYNSAYFTSGDDCENSFWRSCLANCTFYFLIGDFYARNGVFSCQNLQSRNFNVRQQSDF